VTTRKHQKPVVHLATVDGELLTEALRRLGTLSGSRESPAVWRFRLEEVEIRWAGKTERLPSESVEVLPPDVTVAGDIMGHICGRVKCAGPTSLSFGDGHLGLGRAFVPATQTNETAVSPLPPDTEPSELLRKMFTEPLEDLENSDCVSKYARLADKWSASIAKAATELAWTGIDGQLLGRLVSGGIRHGGIPPSWDRLDEADDEFRPPRQTLREIIHRDVSAETDPLELVLDLLPAIYMETEDEDQALLDLLPLLRLHPRGPSLFARHAAREDEEPSKRIIIALSVLAVETQQLGVLDSEWFLTAAVRFDLDRNVLESLLRCWTQWGSEADLCQDMWQHPWGNITCWLWTVIPYLQEDPFERIKWVFSDLMPWLQFAPSDIQGYVASAVGEWIFELDDPDQVEEISQLFWRGGDGFEAVTQNPMAFDALWARRGELGLPVPEEET
jgi:hypothetical protein